MTARAILHRAGIAAIVVILAGASLLAPAQAAPSNAPTNPGTTNLVAWWKLDETSGTRNDAHSTNHLTDNNTVGYVSGVKNNAADFVSANSEYLSISDNAALSITGNMTIVFWLKNTGSPASTQYTITKYSELSKSYSVGITTENKITWTVANSSDVTTTVTTTSTLTANQWNMGMVRYDGSNISASINDGTVYNSAHTTGIYNGTASFFLGRRETSGYFNGDLDEVVIYNRALTADEITWLYNSGAGREYCEIASNCPTATPTLTPTATFTPTATAIPWNLAYTQTITGWTVAGGTLADTYSSNNTRIQYTEAAANAGQNIEYLFQSYGNSNLSVTWEGYYTGGHTMTGQCYNYSTLAWVDLFTLTPSLAGDETLVANIPAACEPPTVNDRLKVRLYHAANGNGTHLLYTDLIQLSTTQLTSTPTPPPATATDTPLPATPTETPIPPTATATIDPSAPTLTPTATATELVYYDNRFSYGELAVTVSTSVLGVLFVVAISLYILTNYIVKKR